MIPPPSSLAATDAGHWREILRPVVEGRRIVLASEVAASHTQTVEHLRALGAADILVIATDAGTGATPAAETLIVPIAATSPLAAIREVNAMLPNPPAAARAALDRFDPDGTALVLGDFLVEAPTLAGRPLAAHRRPEWVALEDKTLVDAMWDRLGAPRAPARVVAVAGAAAAAADLDAGRGTVWAGDSRDGWHGAALRTRFVGDARQAEAAERALGERCDRVRVMSFLEGVPSSIHGVVLPDAVMALRPVEMVVLRRPDGRFFYAGCASFHDPPAKRREEMRSLARATGALLRAEVGFRGPFTIDGVVTSDGFLPTELNPRSGGGLTTITRGMPDLPLTLLLDAVVAGLELDYRPQELERLIVERADRARSGGTWRWLRTQVARTEDRGVARDRGGFTWADANRVAIGSLACGPGRSGSFIRLTLDPARVAAGPTVAPLAKAFWRFADAELRLGIGPLEAARPAA